MADMTLTQARTFLTTLADKSGGQAWFPKQEGAYPDIMKAILQSLQSQYRLVSHYRVPRDGRFHKLEVEAFILEHGHRRDFKVRVREGWRAKP